MPGVFPDPVAAPRPGPVFGPAPPPPAPPALPGPPGRALDDPDAARTAVFDEVLKAAKDLPPVTNARHTLRLTDVAYEGPERISLKEQKKAILRGETPGRRLVGTWRLETPDGAVVQERRGTVARVPYLTDRGTFILNGVENTLANQLRLRAGVFTRQKDNGEYESHVNVLPGQGVGHRVFLDPEKGGVFKFQLGQAKLPLVPVLRALGATDRDMRAAWGDAVWRANAVADDPAAAAKLHAKLVRRADPAADPAQKAQALRAALEAMRLDPAVTRRTLKGEYDRVGAPQLLAATRRLLGVFAGKEDPDDRDHMAYQQFLGPEDLFAERVRLAPRNLRPLLWRASFKNSLDPILPGVLTKGLLGAITQSGLGQPLEEVNPLDVLDQVTRVSRLGYGGIPSIDSIPDEARSVQPSQFGFVDVIRTPESLKAGVDSRVAMGLRKGADGKAYARFVDPKTGEDRWLTPEDVADKVVAFPGELASGRRHVAALARGQVRPVRRRDVDLVVPDMAGAFNHLTNLIPLKSMTKGQRVSMGSRMLAQALPLANAEAPLVQNADRSGRSYSELLGTRMGAVRAAQPGQVVKADADGVTVRHADGTTREYELYNSFPLNRKTFLHNTPAVAVGDRVDAGGLLARSNYTDHKGVAAPGANFRVAYLPARGMNFEDANVISESAARRLASEHMYQHEAEWDAQAKKGKNAFVSLFPSDFDRRQVEALDDDGVVKPGTVVKPGDPLVLLARQRERAHNQVSRSKDTQFRSDSQVWDHDAEGVVTDVEKTRRGAVVTVKALNPMRVGDKLSGLYGDKGVIGAILPDDQMPTGPDGRPYEVLLNPLGVITRTNPGQVAEAVLGKIARATGRPYVVPDFAPHDMSRWLKEELRKHGMTDLETVVDPVTGRKIPKVLTGERYFLKLHHTSESKGQGRGTGGYTNEGTPAKGGPDGSKRVALMDLNALLSHGATEIVRDARTVKGQANPRLWAAFMQGQDLPEAAVPFVNRKFLAQLQAGGVHPRREGGRVRFMALTDKDVGELAGDRELRTADTVDWKDGLKPVKGGLFDPELTGGHGGDRWAKVTLAEPLPNPVMEDPIRRILGLTRAQFEDALAGRHKVDGVAGPAGIARALDRIDLDRDAEQARAQVQSARGAARDQAVTRLRLLKDARRMGLHPRDWMMRAVPVLPPAFRPVSAMARTGQPMVSDANYLYKDLLEANANLKDMAGRVDDAGDERLALYHAFKAVTGLGDPVSPKHQEKGVQGVLRYVFGASPKFGVVQRKLLGGPVDVVGRAVIAPDPDLDMDSVGIPEAQAWSVYRPFVVRRLTRRGVPPLHAARLVKDQAPAAREALLAEMGERPVVLTRAPVLHKYGVMAFWPRLEAGHTMKVSPLVVKGFGADFDGDAMNFHVPVGPGAVRDAVDKLLPSRNLLSAKNFKVHQLPANEYLAGLYHGTARPNRAQPERTFRSVADLRRAVAAGQVDADTRVVVLER